MDRQLPKSEIKKRRIRTACYVGLPVAALLAVILVIFLSESGSIDGRTLIFCEADRGNVENSVLANGKVTPAYEEEIVSSVGSRILEIYRHEGEMVEVGEPLMRLDIESTEAEVKRLSDQVEMSRYATEQTILNSKTYLTNLEMNIKTKEMALTELQAEVANERRLDSLGSGTGERVRQAELSYRTAKLELEQMRRELVNERKAHEATHQTRLLEEGISRTNLQQARRVLENAQVKSSMRGTVTFINSNIGTSIAPGEKLAVLSDLQHFKVIGEIAEGDLDKLSSGADVNVKIGNQRLRGKVAYIIPKASGGLVGFSVLLDDDSDKRLRSGIKVEINVVCGLKENVVRIKNGSYFHGAGTYRMFVLADDGKTLEARDVRLGDSNFDYVEVLRGIREGERVVINDMSEYNNMKSIKLKK